MQIISTNISNILSFPYQETTDTTKTIQFNTHQDGGVHILIGPNGSGKTNFLEIISQTLKVGLIKDFILSEDTPSTQNTIQETIQTFNNIHPHLRTKELPSRVDLKLLITQNDKENMLFLQKQRTIFNTLIKKYTTLTYTIPEIPIAEITTIQTIDLHFAIHIKNQTANMCCPENGAKQRIIDYLAYHELFQLLIILYNTKEEKLGRNFYPLKNTFGYLESTRTFDTMEKNIPSIHLRKQYIGEKNKSNTPLLGYALCIKKIRNIINHSSEENAHLEKEIITLTNDTIKEKLQTSIFFAMIKESVKKYLDLELQVEYTNQEISFLFIDNCGQTHKLQDISHGEQSLLIIIFAIYGFDLKNGLLIIDEPEIHFHPQMQKRLIKMLEKLNTNIGTQFIVSTYSPIFINETNIRSTYRFSKKDGNTIIKTPGENIAEDESALVQMLKFENASKIFFVDKIIMVEGEIDAYFFEYYLQYLHTLPERKSKLVNYEIININGKGGYRKREKFLKKFGIEAYFIGDWDNIVDYGFLTQNDLNYYYKQARNYFAKNNKISGDRHYTKLVRAVKEIYPEKYTTIINNIKSLYEKKVFILQRGDIETYLGMKSKGLEETIEFCHNYFHLRLKNKDLKEHRQEFENILNMIF